MFKEPNLDRTERVLGVFYGGRNQWGGKLIITDQRMIFSELDLGALPDVLAYVGTQAGLPGDLGLKVLESVRAGVGKEVWLTHITDVAPDGMASLFSPPGIRVTTATAETIRIGIVASTTTPNISRANNAARDAAVTILRLAVASAAAG
jgi:hypothetical protein